MADFDSISRRVFRVEGGLMTAETAARVGDAGGETNFGVSQRFLDGLHKDYAGYATRHGIPTRAREVTKEQARQLYHDHFWVPIRGNELPDATAYALFDFAIQSGPGKAIELAQEALGLPVTKRMDEATLAALRDEPERVARAIQSRRGQFLEALARGADRRGDAQLAKIFRHRAGKSAAITESMLAGVAREIPPTEPEPEPEPEPGPPTPQIVRQDAGLRELMRRAGGGLEFPTRKDLPPRDFPVPTLPDIPIPVGPLEVWDVLGAAFRQENVLFSALSLPTGPVDPKLDPTFDPFDPNLIQGTPFEENPDWLIGVQNESQFRYRLAEVQKELADRELIERAGVPGFFAAMLAGVTSPEFLIPVGGAAMSGRAIIQQTRNVGRLSAIARSSGLTARSTALAGFVGASAGEVLLQATQPTRTGLESLINVTAGTLLSGMLGGAIGAVRAGRIAQGDFLYRRLLREFIEEHGLGLGRHMGGGRVMGGSGDDIVFAIRYKDGRILTINASETIAGQRWTVDTWGDVVHVLQAQGKLADLDTRQILDLGVRFPDGTYLPDVEASADIARIFEEAKSRAPRPSDRPDDFSPTPIAEEPVAPRTPANPEPGTVVVERVDGELVEFSNDMEFTEWAGTLEDALEIDSINRLLVVNEDGQYEVVAADPMGIRQELLLSRRKWMDAHQAPDGETPTSVDIPTEDPAVARRTRIAEGSGTWEDYKLEISEMRQSLRELPRVLTKPGEELDAVDMATAELIAQVQANLTAVMRQMRHSLTEANLRDLGPFWEAKAQLEIDNAQMKGVDGDLRRAEQQLAQLEAKVGELEKGNVVQIIQDKVQRKKLAAARERYDQLQQERAFLELDARAQLARMAETLDDARSGVSATSMPLEELQARFPRLSPEEVRELMEMGWNPSGSESSALWILFETRLRDGVHDIDALNGIVKRLEAIGDTTIRTHSPDIQHWDKLAHRATVLRYVLDTVEDFLDGAGATLDDMLVKWPQLTMAWTQWAEELRGLGTVLEEAPTGVLETVVLPGGGRTTSKPYWNVVRVRDNVYRLERSDHPGPVAGGISLRRANLRNRLRNRMAQRGRPEGLREGLPTSLADQTGQEIVDSVGTATLLANLRTNPILRLVVASPYTNSSRIAQLLVDTSMRYVKNMHNIPTPLSVEGRILAWNGVFAPLLEDTPRAWAAYRNRLAGRTNLSKAQEFIQMRKDLLTDLVRDKTNVNRPLTFKEFRDEVGIAMRHLDNPARLNQMVPEAVEMARRYRTEFYEKVRKEFTRVGLKPAGISDEFAQHYLPRVFKLGEIKNRLGTPEGLEVKLAAWFEAEEARWVAEQHAQGRTSAQPRYSTDELMEQAREVVESILRTPAGRLSYEEIPLSPARALKTRLLNAPDDVIEEFLENDIDFITRMYARTVLPDVELARTFRKPRFGERVEIDPRTGARVLVDERPNRLDLLAARDRVSHEMQTATRARAAELRADLQDINRRLAQLHDEEFDFTSLPGVGAQRAATLEQFTRQVAQLDPRDVVTFDVFEAVVQSGRLQQLRGMGPALEARITTEVENIRAQIQAEGALPGVPDLDMEFVLRELDDEFRGRLANTRTNVQRQKLSKLHQRDRADIVALRDILRGTYAAPADPDAPLPRIFQVFRRLNYLIQGGGFMISALPDLSRLVMVHGIDRVWGDLVVPFIERNRAIKLNAKEARLAGTAWDIVLQRRAYNMFDLGDDFGRRTRLEQGVRHLADEFGVISLLSPWNQTMKQWAALVSGQRMAEMTVESFRTGNVGLSEMSRLAQRGIDIEMANRIGRQVETHGLLHGDLWELRTELWDDDLARQAFRGALRQEVDEIIVTPGAGDRPLIMSTELGRTVLQYKSFGYASVQRVLIPGMQNRDRAFLNGVALSTALGMMVYQMKAWQYGFPTSNDPRDWIRNGVDRSGVWGIIGDVNSALSSATRGYLSIGNLLGGQNLDRFSHRRITGTLGGPTFSTLSDLERITGNLMPAMLSGNYDLASSRDIHSARRIAPYNTLWYADFAFDAAEAAGKRWLRGLQAGESQ